jgi:DNA-binding transcriptional MerR regulator
MQTIERIYTVSEVQEQLGGKVTVQTLRNWSDDLDPIITIPRNDQNHRYYTNREINYLKIYQNLRSRGLGREGALNAIREQLGIEIIPVEISHKPRRNEDLDAQFETQFKMIAMIINPIKAELAAVKEVLTQVQQENKNLHEQLSLRIEHNENEADERDRQVLKVHEKQQQELLEQLKKSQERDRALTDIIHTVRMELANEKKKSWWDKFKGR